MYSLSTNYEQGGRDGTELIFLQHESISTLPNPHATKLTKSNHVLHLKKIAKCITYQRHSMYYSNMTDGFFLGRKQCCPSFPRKSCPQPIKWLPHSSQRPRPGRLLFGWLEFLSLSNGTGAGRGLLYWTFFLQLVPSLNQISMYICVFVFS